MVKKLILISICLFSNTIFANSILLNSPCTDSEKHMRIDTGVKEKPFIKFFTSSDKIDRQAWQILQYAAYLDPDFISIEVINELFRGKEEEVTKAIKKLESLALISIITKPNSQQGFRIDQKLQKSVLRSIKNNPKYSIGKDKLIVNLFAVLNKLFPEIDNHPDIKWQIANSLQSHVKKILEQECRGITNDDIVNQANLYYKLAYYHLMIDVDFKQAVRYAETSLEKRRSLYQNNHPALASSLNLMGIIYKELGHGQKGLKYLELGLQMRQQLYSKNHPDIASSLFTIGQTYRELGDTQKALEYTQMALEMNKMLYQGNHIETAKSLNLIGLEYLNLGDFNRSLYFLQQSLQMLKALYGSNHIQIARLLNNIAYNYHKLANYDESLKYAKLSIDINNKLYVNDAPEKIYPLRSYGMALIEVNRIEEGLIALHRALEMSERLGMNKHFITAFVNYNLGVGFFKKGDYQKALDYAKKSLNLRQEIYAKVKNHIEIVESLHNLGDIYFTMTNKGKALECYQKALTMSEALSLDHLPQTKEIQKKVTYFVFDENNPNGSV